MLKAGREVDSFSQPQLHEVFIQGQFYFESQNELRDYCLKLPFRTQ